MKNNMPAKDKVEVGIVAGSTVYIDKPLLVEVTIKNDPLPEIGDIKI